MKVIFALCGIILLVGGVLFWQWTQKPVQFGVFTNAPKVEILDVINHPQNYLHKTVALEGEIAKQCTTMGCYFFLAVGMQELRVDLVEIAMNAPKKRDGRRVRVEGRTVPYDQGFQFMASWVEFQ